VVLRINQATAQVSTASEAAQRTSAQLLAAQDKQSNEIRQTGESVLRMAQDINQVSSGARQSADVARQSLSAAEKGMGAVQNSIAGMHELREQIQETSKRIKRLGESSQEIGEIVELISDITEQTNVLALNAAIQAASAGEAGPRLRCLPCHPYRQPVQNVPAPRDHPTFRSCQNPVVSGR